LRIPGSPLSAAAAAAARDGLSRRLHRLQSPQLSPFFFRVQLFHFSCWFYTSRGFLIIGDCNIHPDNAKHHLTSQLLSLLFSFYLTQHVNFQTHNKKHIYDFGITSSDSCNLLLFYIPCSGSDQQLETGSSHSAIVRSTLLCDCTSGVSDPTSPVSTITGPLE